jgi:hypothetical protein
MPPLSTAPPCRGPGPLRQNLGSNSSGSLAAVSRIVVHHSVELEVALEDLLGLVYDPARYVAHEPCLQSFRWLDADAPHSGARAAVDAFIPFRLAVLRELIGSLRGHLTLTEWAPPKRLAAQFETSRVNGTATVGLAPAGEVQKVHVVLVVSPKSRALVWALRPIRKRLQNMLSRSLDRGASRIALAFPSRAANSGAHTVSLAPHRGRLTAKNSHAV